MSRRNPPAKWVLPTIVNPPGRRCFVIEVPDETFHIAAFRGALLNLAAAYKWEDDLAHTARDVALVWRQVYENVRECPPTQIVGGGDSLEDYLIRQNPDDPCLLEFSADGTHWCLLADFSLCLPSPQQPGAGAEQPPPGGGQACYHGQLQANGLWLLPTIVNTGDVIELTNAIGAGNDGTVSPWRCPDGSTFFGGACIGGTGGTSGSDPAPAVNHMRLLFNIAGAWFDAMGGPVTIPAAVSNAQVFVQVNDSALGTNAGSYEFDVCVTNNAATGWQSVLDFEINSYASILTVSPGVWVAGQGYGGTPSGPDFFVAVLQLTTSAFQITSWDTLYNGAGSSGANGGTVTNVNGSAYAAAGAIGSGTGLHLVGTGAVSGVTALAQSFNSGTTNADFRLRRWTINGFGAKPPQLP